MKNKKIGTIILIILLVIVLIIGAFATGKKTESKTTNSSSTDSIVNQATKESEAIKDSEKKDFVSIDVNKFKELYEEEDNQIVLFSRPGCGYCQIAEPILKNISYTYNFDINNVNTDDMSEADYNNLKSLNSEFEDFGTPFLVIVSNNSIVDKISGLTIKDRYIEFFKKYNFVSE
ncbi:MAG: thioredoxin family protein [Bacilli bacterium]|nr:thioredoxin family protein [Bacilli bacterium]